MKKNLKPLNWENLKDSLQTKGEKSPCLKGYKFETYDHGQTCSIWLVIEFFPNWIYHDKDTILIEGVFDASDILNGNIDLEMFHEDFDAAVEWLPKYEERYMEV